MPRIPSTTYLVLNTHDERVLHITASPLRAFRHAWRYAKARPQFSPIRRGLAFGYIVQGPRLSATVVPTPRHI